MLDLLLLAAGRSTRMGAAHKLLLPFRGRSLIETTLVPLTEVKAKKIIVVIGAEDDALADVLADWPVQIVRNPQPEMGLTASLQCGLHHTDPHANILIALADMPLITPATLHTVTETFFAQKNPAIVRPMYRDQPGHPVVFHAAFRPDLQTCSGDQGAREVVEKYKDQVIQIPVSDAGVITDVDTPEQYHALGQILP